jgi:NAD(P)-dependent dehydrogenase (short-subunit alcohol dehydrogenase family)
VAYSVCNRKGSKFAEMPEGFTKAAALEFAETGVRINVVID